MGTKHTVVICLRCVREGRGVDLQDAGWRAGAAQWWVKEEGNFAGVTATGKPKSGVSTLNTNGLLPK